jgi:hypothetical protein
MKRTVFSLVLVILAAVSKAQTADEIIANYITALGGAEKLTAIKTVKMTGSLTVQGTGVDVTITASQGIGSRTDIVVPGIGEGFQIYTPSKGWEYLPFQGQTSVQEMTEEKLKAGLPQLDLQGQLYNYKEKGNKVELLGKEMFDGMDCYKLKIETAAGRISTLFIDSKTYYRVKSVAVSATTGQNIETIYSNFKRTEDGYTYPFSQTNPNGTIEFSSIEINKPVDVNIFKA